MLIRKKNAKGKKSVAYEFNVEKWKKTRRKRTHATNMKEKKTKSTSRRVLSFITNVSDYQASDALLIFS